MKIRGATFIIVVLVCSGLSQDIAAQPASIVDQQLDKADQYRTQHLNDQAAMLFEQILASDANNFRATYGLGLTYLDQGRTDDGVEMLQRAAATAEVQKKPDYTIYNTLGWTLVRSGHLKAAEPVLQKGLAHINELNKPARISLLNNLGSLYIASGELDKAKPLLQQAADLGSERAKANQSAYMTIKPKPAATQVATKIDTPPSH